MFIACSDLFKIGVGPSSSHTMGPMLAAYSFRSALEAFLTSHYDLPTQNNASEQRIRVTLFGSLAHTGKGHATDEAICLGLHGFLPSDFVQIDREQTLLECSKRTELTLGEYRLAYQALKDLDWDTQTPVEKHPNTMRFEVLIHGQPKFEQRYVSMGGGFIVLESELDVQELNIVERSSVPYPFKNAREMLEMAEESGLSIAEMKKANEAHRYVGGGSLDQDIYGIWQAMSHCLERGLACDGVLPGELHVKRRARALYAQLNEATDPPESQEWLSAYAMAVNEENASGGLVVTAPTNGAAGVIPAVLHHYAKSQRATFEQGSTVLEDFFLTAAAIGGLIKHNSSISGAEVGCQGEVGTASAMAAAGLCAVKGGSPKQIEHAAEVALEHHLGMTCDPVSGLVQVPCIERNAFGAAKAWLAAHLALRESTEHVISLDRCIRAMHQTGMEMSDKYKETSLGGLASSWVEC